MDASIVTQFDEQRKRRALLLAAQGHIHPTSREGTYKVTSQSDRTVTYKVDELAFDYHSRERITGRCTCPDYGMGHVCKHIIACYLYELAGHSARKLAHRHGIDMPEAVRRIEKQIAQITATQFWETRAKLEILALAAKAQVLAADEAAADAHDGVSDATPVYKPHKIQLVIRYRTSGGRRPVISDGEIVTIKADGFEKTPKYTDPERAFQWLQATGYEAKAHRWIDPAGLVRRRRCTFELAV